MSKKNVSYASPNRSHHYIYAEGLEEFGILDHFVSGFPRSKSRNLKLPPKKILFRDQFQYLYLACLKARAPKAVTEFVNFQSKQWIDKGLTHAMKTSDIGVFYNGCGLNSIRRWEGSNKVFVCEAVNSHIEYQTEILRTEARSIGIPFQEEHALTLQKRLAEYEESDYILCPSKFVAKSFLSKGFSEEKLLINKFGINLSSKHSPERKKKKKVRILYVGSVHYRKGVRYLIEAYKRIKHPQKELWIVGPVSVSDQSGLSFPITDESISFKGVLKGDELANAYKESDIFIQPSLEEGLSLVIGEALGFGLPVIATENSGASEFFKSGECGFIVPIKEPQILAEKMAELIEDEDLRKEFGSRAIELSKNLGGWKESKQSLFTLLQTVRTHE